MVISTTYVNMNKAAAVTGGYEFPYNIYKSVKAASALFILNYGAIQAAPCIVTKRESGTYVITYSSTSFYTNATNATKLLTSDPD